MNLPVYVYVQTSLTAFSMFQVYCASNVELITRTRTDHLTEQHKAKPKSIHKELKIETFIMLLCGILCEAQSEFFVLIMHCLSCRQ